MATLHFYDRGPDRPWINAQLTTAAIVGHTTETTCLLWVRVWKPGKYWLVVSPEIIPDEGRPFVSIDAGGIQVAMLGKGTGSAPMGGTLYSAVIGYETDLTAVFGVQNLQPGTDYGYALFADELQPNDWEIPPDQSRRSFRTQSINPRRVAFGVYSCHMPYKGNGDLVNVHMWDNLANQVQLANLDFVIGAGDQVYTDGNKRVSIWSWLKKIKKDLPPEDEARLGIMRSWYRDIFRGYWGPPQVREVFQRVPNYMIWDDHEIMDGWGSYKRSELGNKLDAIFEWENTEQNLQLASLMFRAAKETYIEYEHAHNPPTAPEIFDYSFRWGRCPFYVLDMRGHRDFNRPTDDKVLGPAQMDRFQNWIASAEVQDAPVVFVVSPVPVVHVCSFIANFLDIRFWVLLTICETSGSTKRIGTNATKSSTPYSTCLMPSESRLCF